jgi:glycosyltransferase involved in cell wall biosynthesis
LTTPTGAVVVCTHNRSQLLESCLASIANQSCGSSGPEVVVIDNGSTDDTGAVVERWRDRLAGLRYVEMREVGLSAARNVALRDTTAEVVAFLDDDARATPGWFQSLMHAYRDDRVVAAGGPVELTWPAPAPRWMTPSVEAWFSRLELGPAPRFLADDEYLVGCNLSVRRAAALEVGGFDESLGRIGRRLRSGEDWRMLQLLRGRGEVAYAPDAVVLHEVLPERTRLTWLLRRSYEQGRTNAHYDDAGGTPPRPTESGAALLRAVRRLAGDATRRVRGAPMSEVVPYLVRHVTDVGSAREHLSMSWRRG